MPPKVFICYAHADNESPDPRERWLDRVRIHLKPYENQGNLTVACDDVIRLGEDWRDRIRSQLQEARVAILLISDSFLGSTFVTNSELPVLLQRAKEGGLRIIPIVLSPCAYERIYFKYPDAQDGPEKRQLSSLQSAGSPNRTLEHLSNVDQKALLTKVAQEIFDHLAKVGEVSDPKSGTASPHSISAESHRSTSPTVASRSSAGTIVQGPSEFTNSLGMRFVPVPGTWVGFCIWPTRVQDYEVFAAENSGVDGSWRDPQWLGVPVTPGPTHPVVAVSWEDAQKFCEWLTQREVKLGRLKAWEHYRLPTDLEWSAAVGLTEEKGATPQERDGKVPGVYPWGTDWPPPPGAGNFADETARRAFPKLEIIEGYRDGYATTSPVGTYRPLKNGLHDLSGNVWEWCQDWYDEKKTWRVLRGGSWYDFSPASLLSSNRYDFEPGTRIDYIGFRVVLAADEFARPGGL